MDKPIAKKPVYYRYRWHIAGGIAFIVLLIYVGIAASGGRKLRTDAENLIIGEATSDKFLEYVDVEGVVQPILTIQINTREAGSVDRIIAEEGTMMNKGDTILTLNNPDLIRAIEDQQDEWEKQLISYQEKEIEMEQKSIDLQQKTLQTTYELNRLKKSYALDEEEFNMGVKSKAQLEVARDEFDYKTRSTALQLEGLRHDSAATILRRELMKNDLERERKKFERVRERMEDLVVRAPLSGQLSFVKVTPGQQVQSTEAIAEIKVLDQFKIHTSLSEYYIDRITTGLPATITWQNKKYPLRITKVVPEVKDRNFDVDLVFTEASPENVRIGKSFRVQIELGQPEEALVIPRGDFFQATGGQWIYKLNESGTKARKTPVSIGRQNPQQYEITGGLQPGDKVIVTPMTFAASANCIRYCGGEVVFCDIDKDTYLMDIRKLEAMLKASPRGTYKGIVPVDFAGYPLDLEEFRKLADEYGLWIIEDACHAPGGYFMDSKGKKQHCGNGCFADCAVFSFHPVKHIATGEGGMVTTNSKELYDKLCLYRTHGITKDPALLHEHHGGWYYEMQELGYNYRLTDFQAALGISQLERAKAGLERRHEIVKRYNEAFSGIDGIKTPFNAADVYHAYHLYVIQVADRLGLYNYLHENNVYAQVHYAPLHLMPYYQQWGNRKGDLPVVEEYYEHCLSLPMYPTLTDEEQEYVINKVIEYIKQ